MISIYRSKTGVTSPVVVIEPEFFTFPGGEVGTKLPVNNYAFNALEKSVIVARIRNSEDLMRLVMVKNALEQKRFGGPHQTIELVMPYCPYARQDRVCVPGEPFSLQAFAQVINGLNFNRVTIFDPHSDVVAALFKNVNIITQFEVINKFEEFFKFASTGVFVSPDAGANKKTAELAKFYGHDYFIRADKLRNLHDGKIIETIVYADNLNGKRCIIADDIIDGGRTFIELAKVLKSKGAADVTLYATHGIFSAGVDVLYSGGIDRIFTTNSFKNEYDSRVTSMNLEDRFNYELFGFYAVTLNQNI